MFILGGVLELNGDERQRRKDELERRHEIHVVDRDAPGFVHAICVLIELNSRSDNLIHLGGYAPLCARLSRGLLAVRILGSKRRWALWKETEGP
jgi:hypothetical protein